MKPKLLALLVFIVAMVVQLLGQVYNWTTMSTISKPALMLSLIVYFIYSVDYKSQIGRFVILALGFSWLGDVLLMFQDQNSIYFILGLASFLTAHLLYLLVFRKSNEKHNPKVFTHATGFLLVVFGILLVLLLWPGLGNMKMPVIAYTVVIMTMALSALYRRAEGSSFVLIGAILFVTSDSLLALNKFGETFVGAGFWIMATYILAQYMITIGMISYLNKK